MQEKDNLTKIVLDVHAIKCYIPCLRNNIHLYHAMFSVTRSFRQLLVGCACFSCLSAVSAREETNPPSAPQDTPAASKVIKFHFHVKSKIKRYVLPVSNIDIFPNIFASNDTDYFLALFTDEWGRHFFVVPWETMSPTLIEADCINMRHGGSTCCDAMTERNANLDIEKAVMYKKYFALYGSGDLVQYYKVNGKRIASVRHSKSGEDKIHAEYPEELPAYFELKQKIEGGGAGPEAEVLQSNTDTPSVRKAWEERKAVGLYYTQEKGKLIFHAAGQISVVADISNKPILKEYKRKMTEDVSVFIWLCGSLTPIDNTDESESPTRKVQNPEWYLVFADGNGKIISETTIPCAWDGPLYTDLECNELRFTPQALGDNILILSKTSQDYIISDEDLEYALISPEGRQIASLVAPYHLYAFPYKVRNSYLLILSNCKLGYGGQAVLPPSFIVLPSEVIDE